MEMSFDGQPVRAGSDQTYLADDAISLGLILDISPIQAISFQQS